MSDNQATSSHHVRYETIKTDNGKVVGHPIQLKPNVVYVIEPQPMSTLEPTENDSEVTE